MYMSSVCASPAKKKSCWASPFPGRVAGDSGPGVGVGFGLGEAAATAGEGEGDAGAGVESAARHVETMPAAKIRRRGDVLMAGEKCIPQTAGRQLIYQF
jgi:hypothetical protein